MILGERILIEEQEGARNPQRLIVELKQVREYADNGRVELGRNLETGRVVVRVYSETQLVEVDYLDLAESLRRAEWVEVKRDRR